MTNEMDDVQKMEILISLLTAKLPSFADKSAIEYLAEHPDATNYVCGVILRMGYDHVHYLNVQIEKLQSRIAELEMELKKYAP